MTFTAMTDEESILNMCLRAERLNRIFKGKRQFNEYVLGILVNGLPNS